MKRTGELLKKAREQKGLSINEIGLSLKISSKILKAIEDGNLSQLPAKTFLRGFVQSYASYLRVDVNEIMRIFQEEMGSTRPSPLIQMPERDETLETSDKMPPITSNSKSVPSSEKPLNSLAKSNSSRTVSLTILCV
ncbi:MAG: helix-turn-helix domain-containing protein, partial [Bdellovibrionaceae bacterium]|nr:helix-turn-helix domain-containing protein [Pseudobdellovibrionaceae bacterium]